MEGINKFEELEVLTHKRSKSLASGLKSSYFFVYLYEVKNLGLSLRIRICEIKDVLFREHKF